MNIKRFILITALLLACVSMNAQMKRFVVKVNDFKELRVSNSIPVDYYCNPDSAGYAILYSTDETADWVLFNNNSKGKLTIQTDADYPGKGELPHIVVYSSSLEKITNCGDSLVKTHNLVPVEKFKAFLIGNGRLSVHGVEAEKVEASIDSGNGQLLISGKCKSAKIRNVGTGTILADNLEAQTITASILGTGTIGCNPEEQLTIKGAGTGKVYYRQAPPKIKNYGMGIKQETF